jgi:PleD family two-component response regulator
MTGSGSAAPGEMHLALLINDEEWTTRSIESILKPEGYAVLMAYTGRQGFELASRVDADLLLIDLNLPDINGIDLCSRLRKLPAVRASVPIVLFTSGAISRSQRLQAYRCGAWEVLQPPFDPQELVARLAPYVRAKRDADLALQGADIDPQTGCYNSRGLMRRLKELKAEARRSERPLACVVIGPSSVDPEAKAGFAGSDEGSGDLMRKLGDLILSVTRASDAVARMAQNDFVILAPGTDREGADRLIARVLEGLARPDQPDVSLQAGVCAVSGADADSPAPEEFLRRATSALRDAQTRGTWDGWNQAPAFGTN